MLTEYQQMLHKKWVNDLDYVIIGKKTTICLLTLKNGFEIVGTSACVDPKDFNLAIGQEFALKDALNKLAPLDGFYVQAGVK